MSATPRTDAVTLPPNQSVTSDYSLLECFARQLERELAAVTKERDAAGNKMFALGLELIERDAQLTAALARAEKAEGTPARTSKEYFADHDAFVAYVIDEVNPARKAEGLDTCSAGLAGHLFQVMSEHRHRP